MPTTPSEPRPRGSATLVVVLALAFALGSCSSDEPPPEAEPPAQEEASEQAVDAPDVARGVRRVLARRADAVRNENREAFLAGVDGKDADFAGLQATYFDNLSALPVAELGFELDRSTLVREGKAYWAEVDVTLQLEGYDAVPVVTRDRYLFARGRGERFLVASTSDRTWEKQHDVDAQPWETGPVTVVTDGSVLGIFDDGSAAQAGAVVSDVQGGVAAVRSEVPYAWDGRVVVYGLSDPTFLANLDGLPGDDPLAIDAVSFPVPARPGSAKVASTRFVLNPTMVASPGPARQRLIRHELTHVALGDRQTDAPTWFSEGLAEYVSVQPLAPAARAISGAALDAAERGLTTMPSDDGFNGSASEANYGVAWWACEYLAESYDESMLWVLLDAMSGPDGSDGVLKRVLQINEAKLARKAGRLMLDTYRPEPEKTPEPSESPSDEPSDEPSDKPTEGSGE